MRKQEASAFFLPPAAPGGKLRVSVISVISGIAGGFPPARRQLVNRSRIAVFPGTFDPITHGHLDVIQRGAALFDRLVVGVSQPAAKTPLLPVAERVGLIRDLTADIGNVSVDTFTGMTVEFVKRVGALAILRGIRTFGDFEYECQLALANRQLSGVETIFVMASTGNAFIRSTLIKEALVLGGDISQFVPPQVVERLKKYVAVAGEPGLGGSVGLAGDEPPSTDDASGSGLRGEAAE